MSSQIFIVCRCYHGNYAFVTSVLCTLVSSVCQKPPDNSHNPIFKKIQLTLVSTLAHQSDYFINTNNSQNIQSSLSLRVYLICMSFLLHLHFCIVYLHLINNVLHLPLRKILIPY